jgi:hypothetical protein
MSYSPGVVCEREREKKSFHDCVGREIAKKKTVGCM